jgi:uncharacterized protein YaaW (UPF0174 family)
MLREWQTVNQGGLSPHEMHCHQYLAMSHAQALVGSQQVTRLRQAAFAEATASQGLWRGKHVTSDERKAPLEPRSFTE